MNLMGEVLKRCSRCGDSLPGSGRDTRDMVNYSNEGSRELNELCVKQSVVDVWIESDHPIPRSFTRYGQGGSASRIDRMCISAG